MNKRIKKKKAKQKQMLEWCDRYGKPLQKPERYGLDFNDEGYKDSTAAAAIRNVMNGAKHHK